MLFYILVGLVLGAITSSDAGTITLSEVEQKLISLEQKVGTMELNVKKKVGILEKNVKIVEKEVGSVKQKVRTVEQKVGTVEKEVGTLKQNESNSEAKISGIQNQLEYGGKKYQTLQYNSK